MDPSSSNVTSGSRLPPVLQAQTVFCDTLISLNSALQVLETCRTLFIDCEGVDLGTEGGKLSILSVGAVPPRTRAPTDTLTIYLIDATCLTLTQLGPVFDLLASQSVTKVVWDGRSDYSALYHDCDVEMRNVVDLQIVDILSRASRDSPAEHLNRFRGYVQSCHLDRPDSQRRYMRLHRLSSLLQAVKEHRPKGCESFGKVTGKSLFS
jgi:exonuclease 3'-5' domain-containing protein 1